MVLRSASVSVEMYTATNIAVKRMGTLNTLKKLVMLWSNTRKGAFEVGALLREVVVFVM